MKKLNTSTRDAIADTIRLACVLLVFVLCAHLEAVL